MTTPLTKQGRTRRFEMTYCPESEARLLARILRPLLPEVL